MDLLKEVMRHDTGGTADYAWDYHGGRRTRHDYRSTREGMETRFSGALKRREPMVPRRARTEILFPRLWGWWASELDTYPFVYEPHQFMEKERVFEVGKSIALAFYDLVTHDAPHPEQVVLPGPQPEPQYRHSSPEPALRYQKGDGR